MKFLSSISELNRRSSLDPIHYVLCALDRVYRYTVVTVNKIGCCWKLVTDRYLVTHPG